MENLKLYVARDKNGNLWLYSGKPRKVENNFWIYSCEQKEDALKINNNLFQNVSYDDEEPFKIEIDMETMQVVKQLDKDAEIKEKLDKFLAIQKIVWTCAKDFNEAAKIMQALELFCDKLLKK